MFLNSNNIDVFPSSKPRINQKDSRLLYEKNLTGIIRQLIDKDSFIIKSKNSNTPVINISNVGVSTVECKLSDTVNFNIYGYYFTIFANTSFNDLLVNTNNNTIIGDKYVIAEITLLKNSDNIFELEGQDETQTNSNGDPTGISEYTALRLYTSNDKPESNENWLNNRLTKNLILFSKSENSNNYEVYEDSYKKFSEQSFYITAIDGKH